MTFLSTKRLFSHADLAKPRGHIALRGSGPASPDGKPVQNNRLRAKRLDVRNAAAQRAALMRDERGNPLARQIVLGQERPHRPGYSAPPVGRSHENDVVRLFLLVFFLFYVFCCAVSICAVVFVLLSEMYPTKVRGLAMSIAGFALWIGTYLIGQLTPWMLQNLTPAGTFFLFAVMCVPYMLIVWKLVPETTGKSLEEIERYWTRSEQ